MNGTDLFVINVNQFYNNIDIVRNEIANIPCGINSDTDIDANDDELEIQDDDVPTVETEDYVEDSEW